MVAMLKTAVANSLPAIKPYYDHAGITIYHADCRDILPHIDRIDLVLTDPPYGIDGARGGGNRARGKGKYEPDGWSDTPEYISEVCVPVISECIQKADRVILTPGKRHMRQYPDPQDIGCFWMPAAVGFSPWGVTTFQPILYYGKDPRSGRGQTPNGKALTEPAGAIDHPCAKPINAWKWLLAKGSVDDGDLVFDPFMGSGTTLRAAKDLGKRAIGVEIEERYCEIAASRLQQEVLF